MSLRFRPLPLAGAALALAAGIAGPALAGGTTVTEKLSGPAIGGILPEGEARCDESQFLSGGPSFLTVQVKNLNLPVGTTLTISIDGGPVGTLTLSRMEGTMTTNIGHHALSHDELTVSIAQTVYLDGFNFVQ